jgi:hypothetical protein
MLVDVGESLTLYLTLALNTLALNTNTNPNFRMLVDMGDLPQPDNNVLSEILWNSEHSVPGSGQPRGTLVSSLENRNSLNGKIQL